jgi:putative proteasome-type protease
LLLRDGIVLLSDTRTNAGHDNVLCFGKLHVVEVPGERVVALQTAGNLAITQAVVQTLTQGIESEAGIETLETVPSLYRAAQLVGSAIRRVYDADAASLGAQKISFEISIVLGGQIAGGAQQLFRLYAAGNFIEASADTPYFQIGEHKYGKPILDRALTHDTELADGIKLALISMDSTLRSNLAVGMPIDLAVLRRDELRLGLRRRITEDDDYFRMIRERWSAALREAYQTIPKPQWSGLDPAAARGPRALSRS